MKPTRTWLSVFYILGLLFTLGVLIGLARWLIEQVMRAYR